MATTVQLREVRIALEDAGQGAPLLLLHGFPATRYLWSRVAPALVSVGFRVLVPDLAGYGDSEAPPGVRIDMASQARWMLELLEHVSIPRAVIIAHDVGSAAAQLMVAGAPRRCRGLAVLDGVYRTEWAMAAIASIQAWEIPEAHRLFPLLARRLGRSPELREMLASYQGAAGGARLIRAARDLDPQQTADVGEALRAGGVPAAVLWGERDEYLPLETVGRPLAKELRAALVSLPGAHFTPLDCPLEVTAALLEFLAGLRIEPQS